MSTATPITSTLNEQTINAMELRKQPGTFLDRVFYRNERFVIQKAGETRAVIIPVQEYEQMKRIKQEAKERFFSMTQELRADFANENPRTIEKEIDKAIKEVRRNKPRTSV